MDTLVENGVPILCANRPALLNLAKLFIKMALGDYNDGLHVHLRKDLDAGEHDRLIVLLHSSAGRQALPAGVEEKLEGEDGEDV